MTGDSHSLPAGACIIGLGSRGLGVLERIITLVSRSQWAGRPFAVDVVDPTCDGVGLHERRQPDYLLLNTICCQVSPFPEETTVGETVGDRGPTLYDWVRERGLRLAEDGFTLGTQGREVRPDDYLPRRILGEYLSWYLQRTLERAPEHLDIRLHPARAIELTAEEDGTRSITLDNGTLVRTRFVFLTTGHTQPAPSHNGQQGGEHRRIRQVYPPAQQFAAVTAEQTIALAGTGLSGMDALAALTLGRGGRYTLTDGQRHYLPSGREPRILLYSRTGLPFRARPEANRESGPYQPLVLTPQGVDQLRVSAPHDGLSLQGDLLPLARTEMRIAFHRRCAALRGGPQAEPATVDALRVASAEGRLDAELLRLDGEHVLFFGIFDPEQVLFPEPGGRSDSRAYQTWYTAQIGADLKEARLGLAGSPLKAALEVLRDLRDVLRYAVDFGGLDEKSHEEFYGLFTAVLNRSVTGPQLDRHGELLALIQAGIVSVPFGPEPQVAWDSDADVWRLSSTHLAEPHTGAVDWLCQATSGQPDVERTASPLLLDLMATGRIRRHRPRAASSRGIDITADQHPIDRNGTVDDKMWVLGPLCEGPTFYNHYVPSPGGVSRALLDAHRCVLAMLGAARDAAGMPALAEAAR